MLNDAHKGLRGKWKSILEGLGDSRLDASTLSGRNVACPICGGKDRFRFDDRNEGMWFCNQCGAGDGFKIIQLLYGLTFKQALEKVKPMAKDIQANEKKAIPMDERRRRIEKLWDQADVAPRLLIDYLISRGINPYHFTRVHPKLEYRDDKGDRYYAPAILVRYYTWVDGKPELCTILRRWLDDSKRKMIMPPIHKADAIFASMGMQPKDGWLAVTEGWETALSYHDIIRSISGQDMPVWSAYSAESLIRFNPPKDVKRLHICADVDASYTGQHAAYALAKRLRIERPEIDTRIVRPCPNDGCSFDFNDKLQEMKRYESIRQSQSNSITSEM